MIGQALDHMADAELARRRRLSPQAHADQCHRDQGQKRTKPGSKPLEVLRFSPGHESQRPQVQQ